LAMIRKSILLIDGLYNQILSWIFLIMFLLAQTMNINNYVLSELFNIMLRPNERFKLTSGGLRMLLHRWKP
jgi:hypothetical protein